MHIPPNEGTKSTGLITPWEKKKKKMKPICEYILGMMLFFFFFFCISFLSTNKISFFFSRGGGDSAFQVRCINN